jgi:hypothetical protein
MLYLELQYASDLFLDLMASSSRLATNNYGAGRSFDLLNERYIIEKTTLLNTASIQHMRPSPWLYYWTGFNSDDVRQESIPARLVDIVQKVSVKLAKLRPGQNELIIEDGGEFEITLILNIQVSPTSDSQNARMELSLEIAEVSNMGVALPDSVTQFFSRAFANRRSLEIPLSKFLQDAGSFPMPISHAGITVNDDGQVVALRFQVGNLTGRGPNINKWQEFHAGKISNQVRLAEFFSVGDGVEQGCNFAIVQSANLMQEILRNQIEVGLRSSSQIRLISGVGATWMPNLALIGIPQARADFRAEAIDTPCPNNIGLDVWINTTFRISTINVLETVIDTDWDLDDGDVFVCGLAFGPLGAFALGALGVPFVFGFAAALGIVIGVASTYSPDGLGGTSQDCRVNGKTQICTTRLDSQNPLSTFGAIQRFFFNAISGTQDGLILGGKILHTPLSEMQDLRMTVTVQPFAWILPKIDVCSLSRSEFQGITSDPKRASQVGARLDISSTGTGRLTQPEVTLISADPLGVFPPQNIKIANYGNQFIITVKAGRSDEFERNPYPCKLMIVTNAGMQIIDLGLIPTFTEEDALGIRGQAAAAFADCAKLIDGFYKEFRRFNLKWKVDPSPLDRVDRVTKRSWIVNVSGLTPGEQLTVLSQDGRQITSSIANEKGIAKLQFLTSNLPEDGEVQLLRAGALEDDVWQFVKDKRSLEGEAEEDLPGRIVMRQVELVHQASFPMSSKIQSVNVEMSDARRIISMLSEDGRMDILDASDPSWIQLTEQHRLESPQETAIDTSVSELPNEIKMHGNLVLMLSEDQLGLEIFSAGQNIVTVPSFKQVM